MSSRVPLPVQRVARQASAGVGRVTSSARMLPAFLIVGAQRCGTTSLYKTLAQHPNVLSGAAIPGVPHKGVHYFDTGYDHGLAWYRGHFPLKASARRLARRLGGPVVTCESSPYYLFHPLAGERIAHDLPGVRLVVSLRDPVERAYSAYTHEKARGFETETFERAIELEDERIAGEADRLRADPTYQSMRYQHNAYLARGRYIDQIERLQALVGRDRIHVIDSGDLFTAPDEAIDDLIGFLGLPAWRPASFEQHNARPRTSMDDALRTRLERGFEPYDERLAEAAWSYPELAALTSASPVSTGGEPEAVDTLTRQLGRRSSANLFGAGVSSVAQLVIAIAVLRALPRAEAGTFLAATSLFLVVYTFVRLGTNTGLVWALTGERARGQSWLIPATVRTALRPVLALGLVCAAAILVLAGPLSQRLLNDATAAQQAQLALMLRSLAVFIPVAALYDGFAAATRGAGSMRPTVLVERIGRPILQATFVVVAAVGGTVVGAVWGWVVPYALAFAVLVRMGLPIVRRKARVDVRPDSDESTALERGLTRWFWAFTAPRAVANLGQMVLQRMDIVLVAAIRGPRDAAVYAAATRFLVLGQAAGMSISLAVEPSLGMAIGARDTVRASKVYRTGTTWLILVTWPAYLFCMVAPTLVLSVFGRAFDAGAPVIVLLAATMLVATGVGMVDFVLAMAGRTLWNLANVILAVAVFIVLELLLIPSHGIVGAAIGWSAAILVNNLVPFAQVTGWLHIHPYGRSTFVAAGWAALSCGLLPLLLLSFGSRTIPEMIGALVVSGLVYVVGLWPWRSVLLLDQLPWPGRKRTPVLD